jgi:hypothetical protein
MVKWYSSMKRTAIILLSFIILQGIRAQSPTWGNPDYLSFYAKYLHIIDTIHLHKNDLEIRLWFNNGGNRIHISSFISLARQNNKWIVSCYTFTSLPGTHDSLVVNKKVPVKHNYDSLYVQLLADSLLTLNSDSINEVLDKKGQHRWMWTDSGPTNYTIQILSREKRWTLNYKCPKYFYKEAKIEEFRLPLQIVCALLKIIGINEPC